jgi:hypothetical protein
MYEWQAEKMKKIRSEKRLAGAMQGGNQQKRKLYKRNLVLSSIFRNLPANGFADLTYV